MTNRAVCSTSEEHALRRRTFLVFALLATAGGAGATAKVFWSRRRNRRSGLEGEHPSPSGVRIRDMPVAIPPHGHFADLVPLERLSDLLVTLIPCWNTAPKVGQLLHAFRLWGPDATFPPEMFPRPFEAPVFSGQDLRDIFLDSLRFREVFPLDPPLLYSVGGGVITRMHPIVHGGHVGFLAHVDDLLRACAQLGLSTETPLRTFEGRAILRDMVRGAIWYFDPRAELEWTAEALARYLAPQRTWTNRFGETFCFDDVARALLCREPAKGACFGTHVPQALMCLYRVNERHGMLSDRVSGKVEDYFRDVSRRLETGQNAYGCWLDRPAAEVYRHSQNASDEPLAEQMEPGVLTIVSHHLEWIAHAPDGLRPSKECVRRAIEGMIRGLAAWSVFLRSAQYPPLSHAGSALCLLRNQRPAECLFEAAGV